MKKLIICVFIFCLSLPALGVDYYDFPPELQAILDERIAELESKGGVCIAGRVTMSDGAYISDGQDVMVNLTNCIDEPLWIHEDGWFYMGRVIGLGNAGKKTMVLRAFGYEPVDAYVNLLRNKMTYVDFVMKKTTPEDELTIYGAVFNDFNEPVSDAKVIISFPFANHGLGTSPSMSTKTGLDGSYSFEGLSSAEHTIFTAYSGLAYDTTKFTPSADQTIVEDLKLFPHLKVIIDYVYQPDSSRSFVEGPLQADTIEWFISDGYGVDFSEGFAEGYDRGSLRDIEIRQDMEAIKFHVTYTNGKNGFCALGPVDFDSVEKAPSTSYRTKAKPCEIGHVYVVRTYEGHYAKFVVVDILYEQEYDY